MKTRIDRNIMVWVCATLCAFVVGCFVVGCDMNLPDWWPGVEDRDTTGGATDGTDDDTTDDVDTDDEATGQLKVLITDKPYPFEFIAEALVTITRVEVHMITSYAGDVDMNILEEGGGDDADTNGLHDVDTNGLDDADTNGLYDVDTNGLDDADTNGGDDGQVFDGDGDSQDTPWITVYEGEMSFDLVKLRDGRTDLLADVQIPAGEYNQMRVTVTEGWITLIPEEDGDTDGRVFPLRVPSGENSDIDLHLWFDVWPGHEKTLLLDVDMSRTFKPVPGGEINGPGEIREFTFTPWLGLRLTEMDGAGSISGVVTEVGTNGLDPVHGVSVTAYDDADIEVTTTASNANGAYTVSGLEAGEYRLEFWAAGFEEAELTGIAVTTGQTTEGVDVTLTKLPEP
ncbi:MAG: DUF4382 domain-containing protein [Phycisphaerales bacterium]|nr:MAG: DUF4382 domain-containing protein [Phycisphaerales bacterium]